MFEYLLRMESNTPEINSLQDDVENAIESLQSIPNNNYLTAEKLMSLRNPETMSLNESVAKVEDSYYELMKLMSSSNFQFPTSCTATKRVTFGQTAVSAANTSRSGYEANWGAAPLNEGASRPPLDAPQHLPTRSYSHLPLRLPTVALQRRS